MRKLNSDVKVSFCQQFDEVLTLLFALSKKAFLWLWPGQALAIGTGYDIFRKRRQGWSEVLAPLQEPG